MVVQLPPCPISLRNVQPYLKTALEHDERDSIVSYWCRLYALQTALTIDKKSDEAKAFLLPLMDWLEKTKQASSTNESITNEVAAQAYIENYALKLFVWADNMDRTSNVNKNVVKSFYTSGMLMDVLSIFGELNEDIVKNRKYAKWKAAYIHNCLKNGETPVPGPTFSGNDEENELNDLLNFNDNPSNISPNSTSSFSPNSQYTKDETTNFGNTNTPNVPSQLNTPENGVSYNPHPTPISEVPQPSNSFSMNSSGNTKLDPKKVTKAQKYCKFASSALDYDDVPEAVSNLQKALKLLQFGSEE